MSDQDTAETPADGTRSQRASELLLLLGDLLNGQEGTAEMTASVGRDVAEMSHELTGAIRSFSDSHGHRAAAERRTHLQLDMLIGQGRDIQQRLTRIESRVAGNEMATDDMRSRLDVAEAALLVLPILPPGTNGNGNGHAE